MRFIYFASVRETIGCDSETLDVPPSIKTVGECLDWMRQRDAVYIMAFSDISRLRFALDQQMVSIDSFITGGAELAIFPPVTGG